MAAAADQPSREEREIRERRRRGFDFPDYQSCVNFANAAGASDALTNYPSVGFFFEDSLPYMQRMIRGDAGASAAMVSRWFIKSTQKANPAALTYYMHSAPIIDECYRAMSNTIITDMNSIYDKYKTGAEGTTADLEKYKTNVLAFRESISDCIMEGMRSKTGSVLTTIQVSAAQASNLQTMLNDMIAVRAQVNNSNRVERGPPTYYDDHMQFLEDLQFDTDAIYFGNIPLSKRQSRPSEEVKAIKVAVEGEEDAAVVAGSSDGVLLLATSMAYNMQKQNGTQFIEGIVSVNPYVVAAKAEAIALKNLVQPNGSDYVQQIAQIDIIFNTYYWLKKAGFTRNEMYIANAFFYSLGKTSMNTTKKRELFLKSTCNKIKSLAAIACNKPTIHTPPFVFCYSRSDDLVPVIGTYHFSNPNLERASSWRNAVNMKLRSTSGLTYILDSYNLEKEAQRQGAGGDTPGVYKAFHLFHQFLVSKSSPFEWAGEVEGDALRVQLVHG